MLPGRSIPPGGNPVRRAQRERSLSCEQYGTTWVNEGFVRRMVGEVAPGSSCTAGPRLLRFQDLYVVVPEAGADFSRLTPGGARRVRRALRVLRRRLRLTGWVVDRTRRAPPREVRLLVDGEIVQALRPDGFVPRPDAGILFPYEEVTVTGWQRPRRLAQEAATDRQWGRSR